MVAAAGRPQVRPFAWRGLAYMVFFLSVALGLVPWLFFSAWEWLAPATSMLIPAGPFGAGISSLLGAAVFAFGIAAYLFCSIWLMFYGEGPYVEFDPPTKLVITGPYRWVRNPVASAVLVMILGEAIYFRSPGILVLWLLLVPIAHLQATRVEEPWLQRRFGSDYTSYCATVPRWVPRWK